MAVVPVPIIPNEFLFFHRFFYQGQNIVGIRTLFDFSLFCPCFASLHLPLAALGSAPFHRKEKGAKNKAYSPSAIFRATNTPEAEAWEREWVMPLPSPMM